MTMKVSGAVLINLAIAAIFNLLQPGCESRKNVKNEPQFPRFSDYREIPGVTYEEIRGIEEVKALKTHFVFGANLSTEAFLKDDGSPGGFSALTIERLSALFGIPFQLKTFEWGKLLDGLEDHSIDFTGELTATPERREVYFMTETIAERTIKIMRISGSAPLEQISQRRPLNYCFLDGECHTRYKNVPYYLFRKRTTTHQLRQVLALACHIHCRSVRH